MITSYPLVSCPLALVDSSFHEEARNVTAITFTEVRFSFAEDQALRINRLDCLKLFAARLLKGRELPSEIRELNNPNFSLRCYVYAK